MGVDGPNLSDHLRSRRQVDDILRSSGVPALEFRASIVIGSGGVSFEMVRALVERLPVIDYAALGVGAGPTHCHQRSAGIFVCRSNGGRAPGNRV